MTEITKEQKDFLLELPYNPHSDYNDELDGYENYWVMEDDNGDLTLTITFMNAEDHSTLSGRWKLEFVEGYLTERQ